MSDNKSEWGCFTIAILFILLILIGDGLENINKNLKEISGKLDQIEKRNQKIKQ